MANYYAAVPDEATEFEYGGKQYKSGDVVESDDPCELLGFAAAFEAANPNRPKKDETPDFWDTMRAACPAGSAGTPAQAPAGTPNEGNPGKGDSAGGQGAPAVEGGGLGGGSATPPTGTETPQPGEESKRPPTGEADPQLGADRGRSETAGGDPVDLFSGALHIRETDLEIQNTILSLVLVRTHRSGVPVHCPFGWNWDHNFNVYLRELSDGRVALYRSLREEIFRPTGTGFEPSTGVFELLEQVPGSPQTYDLITAGGNRTRFARPPGWTDPERIPVVHAEDRHGNALRFNYGAQNRLTEVRDDDDRGFTFGYDECGLLVSVADHAGRTVSYVHNEETEQLVAVTSPPTADHPNGIVRIYEYPHPSAPLALRHNVIRVQDTDGRVYVENRYEANPTAITFGRIVEQLYGAYLFQYRYTQLQWVPADPVFVNVPSWQVELMNPDLSLETFTFNYHGDLLDRRFRLAKDGSFRVVAVGYEYDEQGNRSVTIRPDGSRELLTYDYGNPDPRMRNKLLKRELTAAAGFPNPSRIVWWGEYEPNYQLLTKEHSESGSTTTYHYDFDATPLAPDNTGKLKEIHRPQATLPDGTSQQSVFQFEHNAKGQLTATILPDGTRHQLDYGTAGADRSRLLKLTYDAGGLDIVNAVQYDAFGFDSTTVDGNGYITTKTINALGLMEAEQLPPVNGVADVLVLHYDGDRWVSSVERPCGSFVDPVLPVDRIVDTFERDVLGHPVRCDLSVNTSEQRRYDSCFDYRGFSIRTANPDGSRIERTYDERGLLILESVIGADGASVTNEHTYDRNGRMTQVVSPGGATTTYHYDGFDRLSSTQLPNGTEIRFTWLEEDLIGAVEAFGSDGTGNTRTLERVTYKYDERQRITVEAIESFVESTAAAIPVTTTFFHDPSDNIERAVNLAGDATEAQYDGLGRIVSATDPLGNEERYTYDGNSNVVEVERHHVEPDGSVSVLTTGFGYDARNRRTAEIHPDGASMTFAYDARDLQTRRTDPLGRHKLARHSSLGELVEETYETAAGPIVHRWKLDAMSRLIAYTDPTGEVSTYTLDGLGRILTTTYPTGFSSSRTYDAAGNLVEETLGSGIRFKYGYDAANRLVKIENPAVPADITPVVDHMLSYDGLDRLTLATSGAQQVVRHYDSQSRIVREETLGVAIESQYDDTSGAMIRTWPDGRAERYEHDSNGVLRGIEVLQTAGLGSGGSSLATFIPSGPGYPGQSLYQGGLQISVSYDERKRMVEMAANSASGLRTISYRYDTMNTRRIEAFTGANPRISYFEHDERCRLVTAHGGFPLALPGVWTQGDHDAAITAAAAASAAATSTESFTYDPADSRSTHKRTGQPDRTYTYLAGHRPQSDGLEAFTYTADGVLRTDGDFGYEVDALGRVVTITASAATICTMTYDALGRLATLQRPGHPIRGYHYMDDRVVQETDDGSSVRQATLNSNTGLPVAYHIPGATHYTLFDGRTNLTELADTAGAFVESYRYAAFGQPAVLDPTGGILPASQFGIEPVFGGQRYLPAAARYIATRRMMNPEHGMFLAPDPFGYAASPSLYVYAAQDPVDLADPDGEIPLLAILLVMGAGAIMAGGLNVVHQGLQMVEDPKKRSEGFSGWELAANMGVGAVLAPVLMVAPELAPLLAVGGVYGGIQQIREGNVATGLFDIAVSAAPFRYPRIRNASMGRGTVIGKWRGLGPTTGVRARLTRFPLIQKNWRNFLPAPFGRRVGVGFAEAPPGQRGGSHMGAVVEAPEGGEFWFFDKNLSRSPDGRPTTVFGKTSPPPEFYNTAKGTQPFQYDTIRTPRRLHAEALGYAQEKMANIPAEKFNFLKANCGHHTAAILGRAGFSGMSQFENPSVLFNDFTNFTSGTRIAYSAAFWARLTDLLFPPKK